MQEKMTPEQFEELEKLRKKERQEYARAMRDLTEGSPDEKRLAQQLIAASPKWSYVYAYFVKQGRWAPGEAAIASDPYYATYYTMYVTGERLAIAEPVINASSFKSMYDRFIAWMPHMRQRHVRMNRWTTVET